MASVLWTVGARDDLREIIEYISQDSPTYGAATADRILGAVDGLHEYPKLGRVVPEYDDESIRELIVGNYRIVYRLRKRQVVVLTLVHGSRDLLRRQAREPWDFG